jgi:hypothetical protein
MNTRPDTVVPVVPPNAVPHPNATPVHKDAARDWQVRYISIAC